MWICFGGFRRRCEDASWGSTGSFTDPSNLMPAVKFPAARRGFVLPAKAGIQVVIFSKPIDSELIVEINFSELNPKKSGDIELLYNLTREGLMKSALGEFHTQQQALSRFFMGALVVSNPVLEIIRRELRRISPDVRIDLEQIKSVLVNDVLKREVVESEKAEEARKKINRAAGKLLRASAAKQSIEPEKQPEKIETKTEREETEPEI